MQKAENFIGGLNGKMLLGYMIAERGPRELTPPDATAAAVVSAAKTLGFPRQSIGGWIFLGALLASRLREFSLSIEPARGLSSREIYSHHHDTHHTKYGHSNHELNKCESRCIIILCEKHIIYSNLLLPIGDHRSGIIFSIVSISFDEYSSIDDPSLVFSVFLYFYTIDTEWREDDI